MTGAEFKQIRFSFGLSIVEMAEKLEVKDRTIQRWEAGTLEIHGSVVPLLRILRNVPEARDMMGITLSFRHVQV